MTRMTPSEVVDLFRQQQRDYEEFASRSSGSSADSFQRVAEAWKAAADVVSRHLVPHWDVPQEAGCHWLEQLPEDAGPKQVRREFYNGWHQYEWWNGGGWVRVKGRVCRVSGRPEA